MDEVNEAMSSRNLEIVDVWDRETWKLGTDIMVPRGQKGAKISLVSAYLCAYVPPLRFATICL